MQSCVIVAVIVEQSSIQSTDKCQQKKKKDLIINKSCLPEATHVTPVAKNKDQMPLDSDSQVTASTGDPSRKYVQFAISLQLIVNNNNI